MRATIKMIAEQARVSAATVSMVLNKKDSRISETTRRNVLEIAAAMQYQPNVIARSLVTAETKTVGLLIPDVSNPFFAEIAKCIETRLNQRNYHVFLCNSNNDKCMEKAYLRELVSRNIDGLIVSSVNLDESDTQEIMRRLNMPFVVFDRLADCKDFPAVSIEDRCGGRMAAQELLANGHRRIACLCGSLQYRNIRERVAGFQEVLSEHVEGLLPEMLFEGELTLQGGYESAKRMLSQLSVHGITAIFCTSDLIAFGAYKAVKESGLRIADDISVIGFDNIEFSEYLTPPLTTIGQPIARIGERSVRMLLAMIGHEEEVVENYTFPVRLLRRSSVKNNK